MAYIYNEKTGEFVNSPEIRTSNISRPEPQPRPTKSFSDTAVGNVLLGICGLALQLLPYLLICGLCSLCS